MNRAAEIARNVTRELSQGWSFGQGTSALRLCFDILAIRVLRRARLDRKGAPRVVRARDGATIRYRLNSGDLQSMREVLFDNTYRLPIDLPCETLVDLGANIGLSSVWLARQYGFRRVIAVEPLTSNAELAEKNLAANGVNATVVRAAVGPADGKATFAETDASNIGRVGVGSLTVDVISMRTILSMLPAGAMIDLVKMDIEGGEQALLVDTDTGWLSRVRAFIVEFHPEIVDHPRLIETLKGAGFSYYPPSPARGIHSEFFVRHDEELAGASTA
jgi:FkbM family methyltransferase